jgi:hypothetical protein
MKRPKPHYSPAQYRTLLPTKGSYTCGVTAQERSMELLKLEVETAITKNFWGNPEKPWRPKTDPGAGGFQFMAFGVKWPKQRTNGLGIKEAS